MQQLCLLDTPFGPVGLRKGIHCSCQLTLVPWHTIPRSLRHSLQALLVRSHNAVPVTTVSRTLTVCQVERDGRTFTEDGYVSSSSASRP
eukprot:30699-Eustigmatos_ZCMA.PRE.1